MAQPSVSAIYDRIHSASGYHPFSAATFMDWSMEAGDIVSVIRDGKRYSSPVHASQLVWKGSPQISIESTGNREKEAVAVMSSKKLSGSARGGSGYRNSKDKNTSIQQNEDAIVLEAWNRENEDNQLYSRISVTAEEIRSEVARTADGLYSTISQTADRIEAHVEDVNNSLSSTITQTATQIRAEVNSSVEGLQSSITQTATQIRSEVTSSVSELQSSITQESNRISLVVEGTGSNAKIKPASIVASINSSGSTIALNADKVNISGSVKLSDCFSVDSNSRLHVAKRTDFASNVVLGERSSLVLQGQSQTQYTITAASLGSYIAKAEVAGNVLTLTAVDGTETTFSKATSLSGSWSSNTYTVTASPQGTTISTSVSSRFGVNQGNYYIEAYRSADQDAPGISGSSITYQMANNNGTVELQNTEGTKIADTPTYTIPASAVTLEGAWSSNTYTVSATSGSISGTIPSTTVLSRFNAENGAYFIETYRSTESGAPAVSNSSLTYQLANNSGTIEIQDSNGSQISNTPTLSLEDKTDSNKITSNGTYNPSGSYVGFSSVEVDVQATASTYLYKTLDWQGGSYSGTAYTSMEFMTKNSSDDTMADHAYRYFVNDFSRNCVRVYTTLGQSGFSGQEHVFNMDPFVSHISISFVENTTDRSKVSGATSLSFRQSVVDAVNGRKYCIFTAKLEGADTSKKYYFDFT